MSNAYIEFYSIYKSFFSSSHKPYLLLQYEVQSESVGIFLYTFYISLPRSLLPQIHRINGFRDYKPQFLLIFIDFFGLCRILFSFISEL